MTNPHLDEACSLPEPLRDERIAWIREELQAARAVRALPDGALFEFDTDPARRERLDRLVTLERACCDPQQIRFELQPDAGDGRVRLALHGIDADHPWLRSLPGARPA